MADTRMRAQQKKATRMGSREGPAVLAALLLLVCAVLIRPSAARTGAEPGPSQGGKDPVVLRVYSDYV